MNMNSVKPLHKFLLTNTNHVSDLLTKSFYSIKFQLFSKLFKLEKAAPQVPPRLEIFHSKMPSVPSPQQQCPHSLQSQPPLPYPFQLPDSSLDSHSPPLQSPPPQLQPPPLQLKPSPPPLEPTQHSLQPPPLRLPPLPYPLQLPESSLDCHLPPLQSPPPRLQPPPLQLKPSPSPLQPTQYSLQPPQLLPPPYPFQEYQSSLHSNSPPLQSPPPRFQPSPLRLIPSPPRLQPVQHSLQPPPLQLPPLPYPFQLPQNSLHSHSFPLQTLPLPLQSSQHSLQPPLHHLQPSPHALESDICPLELPQCPPSNSSFFFQNPKTWNTIAHCSCPSDTLTYNPHQANEEQTISQSCPPSCLSDIEQTRPPVPDVLIKRRIKCPIPQRPPQPCQCTDIESRVIRWLHPCTKPERKTDYKRKKYI